MTRNAHRSCPVCAAYTARRGAVLEPHLALAAFKRGVRVDVVEHEYLTAVHDRHLAGGSLSTRDHTPVVKTETGSQIRVQRACNGCGASLGDTTADELEHAVAGWPLPDVRLECGCHGQAVPA